jgi:ERCC4-related helicase
MNIGDQVISQIYQDKGPATILSFATLFGEEYAELLFVNTGERLATPKSDLVPEMSLSERLKTGKVDSSEWFLVRNMALRLKIAMTDNKLISAANYKIKPLPHQLLTVNFVMNRFQPRCLIADEVGLGKTIEAILVYQEYKLRHMAKRILIIVPSGLVLQWHEELLSKFNEQFVIYSMEQIRSLKQSYGEDTNVWTLNDRIIVSIDSLKPLRISSDLDKAEIKRREWHNQNITQAAAQAGFDIAIIDEAHRLSKKDDGSQSARFLLGDLISEAVPIFLLLTATPHQGDPALFHHLMKLIDPVMFASPEFLTPELIATVTVRNKKRAVVDFDGKRIFKHRITSMVDIKRTIPGNQLELELYQTVTEYTSHNYDLAKQTNNQMLLLLVMLYQRILSSSSFALYDTMKRRLAFLQNGISANGTALETLDDSDESDLKQLISLKISNSKEALEKEIVFVEDCLVTAEAIAKVFGDAKLKELLRIIEELKKRENNPELKVIVFTEFRATQEGIKDYLSKYGYSASLINGSFSREQKAEQVELFRTQNQILISTDAGGEGINLQFCYCMINYDLPWNPARLEQRIGRIDRIGQEHNALIFNFHLADTVEDHVRETLELKLETIKEQFGEDKYTDVLNLLQEEFDFDRIYIDAVQVKERENIELDRLATQIYQRAQQIIEKDALLIPFMEFNSNPQDLLQTDLQKILKILVFQYLKQQRIAVNQYKDAPDRYYFTNPFKDATDMEGDATLRNVTFNSETAFHDAKVILINLEHPLVEKIIKEVNAANLGQVAALQMQVNKFSGIKGIWFLFELHVSNNVGKDKDFNISVFMEDEKFDNSRISNYLEATMIENASVLSNAVFSYDLQAMESKAFELAQEKANDIYTATKLRWLEELEVYEKRSLDYNKVRRNAINNIQVENIRQSKLHTLEADIKAETQKLKLARNVIPQLTLKQVAYLEFS